VLLVPLHIGNAGLNMQAASHAIFLDPPDKVTMHAQALGRLTRQGQRKPVLVTRFLGRQSASERRDYLTSDSLQLDSAPTLEELPLIKTHPQEDNFTAAFRFWHSSAHQLDSKATPATHSALLEQCIRAAAASPAGEQERLKSITFVQRALRADIPVAAWKRFVALLTHPYVAVEHGDVESDTQSDCTQHCFRTC
jgi:superfamily II DNA or RNA helicase